MRRLNGNPRWAKFRIVASLVLLGSLLILPASPAAPQQALAAPAAYSASLSGPAESPANASPGTGFSQVELDWVAHTLHVRVNFSGLVAPTTASHIHACTTRPGEGTASVATQVPTFNGFPLGVTSGTYDRTFNTLDPATYNPAYLNLFGGSAAVAELALGFCLISGGAYLNVHSTTFPGGEIRGFLTPTVTSNRPAINVKFGLPGDPIDPPGQQGGGATRDRVDPPVIIINSGDTINYVNDGGVHRVAVYDKNLAKNGSGPTTTLADINEAAGTGFFLDDPVGRLALGAPAESVSWTFTNTSSAVQQYVVICAFRPHFVDNAMAQTVLVRPPGVTS
jgi:hypothetical protein